MRYHLALDESGDFSGKGRRRSLVGGWLCSYSDDPHRGRRVLEPAWRELDLLGDPHRFHSTELRDVARERFPDIQRAVFGRLTNDMHVVVLPDAFPSIGVDAPREPALGKLLGTRGQVYTCLGRLDPSCYALAEEQWPAPRAWSLGSARSGESRRPSAPAGPATADGRQSSRRTPPSRLRRAARGERKRAGRALRPPDATPPGPRRLARRGARRDAGRVGGLGPRRRLPGRRGRARGTNAIRRNGARYSSPSSPSSPVPKYSACSRMMRRCWGWTE